MEIRLTTTLKAYPKLAPSILDNYVTDSSLEEILKDYVTDDSLNNTLTNYVTEVLNPEEGIIYGRLKVDDSMDWVPCQALFQVCICGLSDNTSIDGDIIKSFELVNVVEGDSLIVEIENTSPNYVWFCSTRKINNIEFLGPWVYSQPREELENTITIIKEIGGVKGKYNLACYRTPRLIASTYRFKIYFGEAV